MIPLVSLVCVWRASWLQRRRRHARRLLAISIGGADVQPAFPRRAPVAGPVYDVIKPNDEKYQKAVAYAVGDAVLCDTLDEARQLAYHSGGGERYKVVTIDGSLINKAGLMTGGSSNVERARASKWDKKEYGGLKERFAELTREMNTLGSRHTAEEKAEAVRDQLQCKKLELDTAKKDLVSSW